MAGINKHCISKQFLQDNGFNYKILTCSLWDCTYILLL